MALALAACLVATPGAATPPTGVPAPIELDLGFYGSVTLLRGGENLEFEHFGGNAETIFGDDPLALESAESYRAMRIAGFTLTMVGAGLLLSELVLILAGSDAVIDETATGADGLKPLTFILLGSGLGLSVVGIGLETSSLGYLTDAVRQHNRHSQAAGDGAVGRSDGAGASFSDELRIGLSVRGRF